MKRVFLFIVTNLAILLLLGIVSSLLQGYLQAQGIDFPRMSLLLFAAVFGMGGSFISLAISKWIAKRTTGARVIEQPASEDEHWLVETVRQHAQAAGIGMPEVAIFPSPSPNAFATGARRDSALVAVSAGLMSNMDRQEISAVIGHEVSHIANGDMVTLTLIQGVLNTFVLFFSRIIGEFIDRAVFRSQSGRGIGYFVATIFAQIVLGFFAAMIVMWFSRRREFSADAGGANLAGRPAMVAALQRLGALSQRTEPLPDQMAAMGISGGGMRRLLASHPPIEERIRRLQMAETD
ncbi:MAG: protease HtpX [Myxococcales bacterium]|nr:protease HtpX [Myxococcales bacterium]